MFATQFRFSERLSVLTVDGLIELALQLDVGMYAHLPESWRNPGIAGLCAFRLLADALEPVLEQCSPEVRSFAHKIESLSAQALERLDADGEPALIKPLVNELFLYSGNGGRIPYTEAQNSVLMAAVRDLPKKGQLAYRPQDGRFFVLVDPGYMSRSYQAMGCEDQKPRAALQHPHVTVNDGMSLEESQRCLSDLIHLYGETQKPVYFVSQPHLLYLDKTVEITVIGGYQWFPRTNSRMQVTHQLQITSHDLELLEEKVGLGSRLSDYHHHLTFAEVVRVPYSGLSNVGAISEHLGSHTLSQRLKSRLIDPVSSLRSRCSVGLRC